jgi:signal transduction histidine kinase
MLSELAVPLINAGGQLEGILNLESPISGAFGDSESHLIQALATQAVIAIQDVKLIDALKELSERLLTDPYQEVLSRLVVLATDLLNAAASAIWRREGDWLILQAGSPHYNHSDRLPLTSSLAGEAVLTGKEAISRDVQNDPRFHRPDLAAESGWHYALSVPLILGDDSQPTGAFSVYGIETGTGQVPESEWDKKVLTMLADYAALAGLNAVRQEALLAAKEQRSIAETFAAVGDVAANVIHQLNNRVGIIPVRVEGIQDKCQDTLSTDSYLAENLAEIGRSAREAMRIVRQNMNLLRPAELGPVYLRDCVNDAIHAVGIADGVTIQVEGLDDLPPVMGARQTLVLVFTNLFENAAHAMGENGSIHVNGMATPDAAQITIHDNGPGIAADLQDRIFEFSFSGDQADHAGKLGFGLWWINVLITRLGGSIIVDNDDKNGARFVMKLPTAPRTLIAESTGD